MNAIIEARGLTREFRVRDGVRRRRVRAVIDLDLRVEAGEAVGYIGANGAGKSTTIKMLTGILKFPRPLLPVRPEGVHPPHSSPQHPSSSSTRRQ